MRSGLCRAARGRRGATAAACLLAAASTLSGCSRGLRAGPPALAGGSILARSGPFTWALWNESTGEAVRNFSWHDQTAVLSPTGDRLLTTDNSAKAAMIRSASTGEILLRRDFAGDVIAAFSPTGQHVLIATCCEQNMTESFGDTYLDTTISRMMTLDAATGEVLLSFTYHGPVSSAAWSPTGDYLLTASEGIATLWNASTGEALREFKGQGRDGDGRHGPGTAVFSPAGECILTTSWGPPGLKEQTAKMWNASTGEVLRNFTGHTSGVVSAVFSPKGDRVLTASWDGTAIVWDASTGEDLQRFTGQSEQVMDSAVFSPTGDYVLTTAYFPPNYSGTSDFDLGTLWNASSGEVLSTFGRDFWAAVFLPKLWAASGLEG